MQSTAQKKAALRKIAKAARDSIGEGRRREKSAHICLRLSEIYDALAAHENRGPIRVCVYQAFGSEADVEQFAIHVWSRGGQVAFPCMENQHDESAVDRRASMAMRLVSREAYAAHREGGANSIPFLHAVTKPLSREDGRLARFPIAPPESVDMVVVPLVAFDDDGGRLGYGGGNYDEFLRLAKPDATIVGVGFAEQRIDRVPREPHDIGIPRIVSA